MKKRITSLLVVLTMLCAFVPTTFAENDDLVSSVGFSDGVVTVKGSGEKNEAINIFVLEPGKTVADLNNANTDALFDATVNYADVIYTDNSKLFDETFKVKNAKANTEYVLYVKSKSNSYTQTLCEKSIYVATNGNDTKGDGTENNPYATIAKAKEAVAAIEKTGKINVVIRGGEYRIAEGLTFTAAESGNAGAPVVYKAAEGEEVILNGSTRITDFAIPSEDVKAKFPEEVRDSIVEIDLSSLPQNVVNFYGRHTTAGQRIIPAGVFLNDDEQTLSEWPNTGYKGLENIDATAMSFNVEDADTTRTAKWAESKDDMVVDGFFKQPWRKESAKISSINNGKVTIAEKPFYGFADLSNNNANLHDTRVTVRNVASEVDVPGEYYIDFSENKMYYYAPYTLTAEDTFEIATLSNYFVNVDGCEFTSFEGIEFTKAAAVDNTGSMDYHAAIMLKKLTQNQDNKTYIKDCKITNIGTSAIYMDGYGINIENNVISNIGMRAICGQGGSVKELKPSNSNITNNVISRTGVNATGSNQSCINFWGGYGIVVANNTIHDTPNSAVVIVGNNQIVKNNEIYNTINDQVDAGAVYAGRSYTQYGFKVENNYIHNVGTGHLIRSGNSALHVSGVYLDDHFSGATVSGNIIDMGKPDGDTYAIIQTGGIDNTFTNNIVANATRGYAATSRNTQAELVSGAHYSSNAFLSFLDATDYSSSNSSMTKQEAALKIGQTGGPQWIENIVNTYEQIKPNYASMMAATMPWSTKITDNKYYNTTYPVYEDVTGVIKEQSNNTEISNLDSAISGVLSANAIGATEDVIAKAEEDFDLVYPANKATINTTSTYITWQASDFADEYSYKVFNGTRVVKEGTTKETFAYIEDLTMDETYTWTVDAISKSRIVDKTYNSGEYSFKVAQYSFSANYDKDNAKITVTAKNNGAAQAIMMIAAVKVGTELKAVTMRNMPETEFITGYDASPEISLTQEMKDALAAGGTLELYIWNKDMKSLTGKIQF